MTPRMVGYCGDCWVHYIRRVDGQTHGIWPWFKGHFLPPQRGHFLKNLVMFEGPLVRTLTGFTSLSKTLDSWNSIKMTVALTTTNLRTGQNLIIFWVVRKAPSGGIFVDSLKIRCKMDHAKWKGLLFRALRSHSCPFLPFGVGAELFSVGSSLWQKTCIYFTSFFFWGETWESW